MINLTTSTLLPTILSVAVSNTTGTPCDLLTFDKNDFCFKKENKYFIEKTKNDYSKIEEELNSYSFLENNWDGYGAVKPSDNVIQTTRNFIKILKVHNTLKPKLMLSGDDEIALFWKNKRDYLEISIDNSSKLTYFYRLSGKVYGEDNLDIKLIPKKFTEALESFLIKLNTSSLTTEALTTEQIKKPMKFNTNQFLVLAV